MQNMKYLYVKVPYNQIRSAWKWYCWVGLDKYKTKFKKKKILFTIRGFYFHEDLLNYTTFGPI
jgi:hypothetical protein